MGDGLEGKVPEVMVKNIFRLYENLMRLFVKIYVKILQNFFNSPLVSQHPQPHYIVTKEFSSYFSSSMHTKFT